MIRWKIDEAKDLPLAIIEDTEDGTGICEIGKTDENRDQASEWHWNIAREIVQSHNQKEGKPMKIRDLLDQHPKLYDYDYKWKDSERYKNLDEILEILGFKLVDDDVKAGEYNDIKGYFGCEITRIEEEK